MRKRILEYTFRKKRVQIEFVDLLGLFLCLLLVLGVNIGTNLIFGYQLSQHYAGIHVMNARSLESTYQLSDLVDGILFYFLVSFNYYSIRALINKANEQQSEEKYVIFIDQIGKTVFPLDLFRDSRVYWFLTEPYIYRVRFLTDHFEAEPYKESFSKLHFNFPPHKSYRKMKNYDIYQYTYDEDPRKTDKMRKSNRFSSFSAKKNKNGRDWHRYDYIITYEKAQLLNQVFDAVELPAFRVVVNEKRRRLISIHPIEGREYPEEVPELLDKINQMYP